MPVRRRFAALTAGLLAATGVVVVASTPAAGTDLSTPIKAAFAYEWFPETENWATQYHPALGKYDSSNPTIVAAHVAQMRWAGLDAGIYSWWGRGTPTDNRMPMVLDAAAAQGLAVTAYYEPEGTTDPTVDAIRADLLRLSTLATHPAWLRVGGKPVLFVYNANETSCAIVDKWKQAAPGWYLQLKVFSGYAACPSQPDSWHQYGPATALSKHGTHSMNASPGFWKFNEANPRLARNLDRWRTDLSTMADTNVQWKLITSLNEWGEGTAVEPATEWQTTNGMGDYLTAMRDVFVNGKRWPGTGTTTATATSTTSSSTATSTSSSSSTPTSSSTSTPTPTSTTTTTPPAGAVTVAAVGDAVCAPGKVQGTTNCAEMLVSEQIANANVDAFLGLGDLQYESGTLSEFQQKYHPSFGRLNAKSYPAPGNHEWLTGNAQGYRDYFRGKVPAAVNVDRLYYSFNLGAWHIVSLDSDCSKVSGCSPGNPQYEWLKQDLAANDGKPTLVFWHHPRFTSADRGDSTHMVAVWNLLVTDKDAQLVLAGHEHMYERFTPMGATAPDPAGVRSFVVGTGGKNHICPSSSTRRAGSEVLNCNTYGPLILTLRADGYDWRFVPTPGTGTFTDQGSQPLR